MLKVSKRIMISGAAFLMVLASLLYFWHRHMTRPVASTTSKSHTAQNDYTGDNTHENAPISNVTQGGAKDNHGDKSIADEAGVSSASGVVKVISPIANGTLDTGDTVRGAVTGVGNSKVQYRLIDDEVGVIAQGSLDVVNGTYSGTLQFKAYAKTGRLDVFTYDSQYREINEVQLPVELGGQR